MKEATPELVREDRDLLDQLAKALHERGITAEIVVPDIERPWPALNLYHPERTYAVESVWHYAKGDALPARSREGAHVTVRATASVFVWGGHYEHVAPTSVIDTAAALVEQTFRAATQ